MENVDLFQVLQGLLEQFVSQLPPIFGSISILLLGIIVATLFSRLLFTILQKLRLDKMAGRVNRLDLFNRLKWKLSPSLIISRLIYYMLLLLFVIAATDVLNMPEISDLLKGFISFIPSLIFAIIIFFVGIFVADFLRKIVLNTCESFRIPAPELISSFVFYLILVSVGIIALAQAGVETDFISNIIVIIIGGLVLGFGIGYGLASQHLFANLLGAMYSKDKVHLGDEIEVDGIKGKVIYIGRTSLTLDSDGVSVMIPMVKISTQQVKIFKQI